MRKLVIAASLVMLASVPAAAASMQDSKPVAAAPTIAPPPPGMGQIVFYRSSVMGAAISCRVHANGEVVNRLPPGKYFVHQAAPGVHEFSVKSEATDKLKVNVEEGETSYVRCAISMGFMVGRPNLSTQTREDFDKRGKSLKLQPAYVAKEDKDKDGNEEKKTAAAN
ncbi:DUF2846 domain-containing protein [Sphingomonas sp. LHG3406-1]|uniref:DUF2846 domain-containing protein n=1 Tax=Sphingomonas sp. LHG3406-1 TaxID=2804617 RepID=UPI00262BDD1C|nr:DUF2846 domain-containing protein [Sphingomonas sp. LHG3406-1]